jgi:ABC-type ATPase with predicted acetyltransferase domain
MAMDQRQCPAPLSLPALIGITLWPLVVALLAGVALEQRGRRQLADALSDRAPLVVVDELAFVKAASDRGGAAAGIREAREVGERLRAAGYVVIDRRYVAAAPDRVVVRP